MREVRVQLGSRSYPVLIGAGSRNRLNDLIPHEVRRVGIIIDPVVEMNIALSVESHVIELKAREHDKTIGTVETIARELTQRGFTRSDLLVAVGGGMLTDTVGLVAALYHRGMRYFNVPTTLLGQVDAAVGGKTGVNLDEGKNLLGAFWQPTGVVCDTDFLSTLPHREMQNGLGEIAKYALLKVPVRADMPLADMVAACVEHKASVVSGDEADTGQRAMLNYGHTLAHALETSGRYELRHGEAVAMGLVFAARVGEALGRGNGIVERTVRTITSFGLEPTPPTGFDATELIAIMRRDKKASDGLTMVLDGDSGFGVVSGIGETVLRECLEMK